MQLPDQAHHGSNLRRRWIVPLFLLIGLMVSACGGLGGEPAIIATLPPPTSPPATVLPTAAPIAAWPAQAPDVAAGAAIFAQSCTQCHGPTGAGDGALVQNGQVMRPASFLDADHVRGRTPFEYYTIITNGIIESLMPPWRDALTLEERWSVTMYVYTLHQDTAALEQGELIYARECASCHGDTGRGDGPEFDADVRGNWDLTDPEKVGQLSDRTMFTIISEGAGHMPAFADTLSEEERWAVTDYTRALPLTASEQTPPAETTAEATPEIAAVTATRGTIRGQVIQGTEDAAIPEAMEVTLHIFDMQLNEESFTTIANADGTYTFNDVPIDSERAYFASVDYAGRSFASPPVQIDPRALEANLDIFIYEVTNDASVIQIVGIISQIFPSGNTLEVLEIYRFNNTSDRLYSSSDVVRGDRFASVRVTLPVGAVVIGLEDETRFIVDQDNFTVTDTRAVLPGADHFVRLSYLLPYNNGAVVEVPVHYALNGPVRVLLPPDTLNVRSNQFSTIGLESIGPHTYMASGGTLTLPVDSTIRYELSGRTGAEAAGSSGVITGSDLLPVLLIGAGLVVLVIAGLVYLNQRRGDKSDTGRSRVIDGLVRQIAELDSDHEAGRINHDVYQQRRAQLKARLAELIDVPTKGDSA